MHAVTSPTYGGYNREKEYVRGFRKLIQIMRSNSKNERLLYTINVIENMLMHEININVIP